MACALRDWTGLVRNRTDDLPGVDLQTPGPAETNSWAGPFRGTAMDGNDYFIKTLQTCPPGKGASLAVELIVARAGRLVGAPVCYSKLIRITDEFDDWAIRPGTTLRPGWAHGSLAIERSRVSRPDLDFRRRDDNRVRHVGAYALYDWCYGYDRQWLHDLAADQQMYSFDHGLYFPAGGDGKMFNRDMLQYHCDDERVLPDPPGGLSPDACESFAEALESVGRSELVQILGQVPRSWPISDDDLEAVGWFLEYRAPRVADRIRKLGRTLKAIGHV